MLRKGVSAIAVGVALVAGLVGLPSTASAAGSGFFEIIAGNADGNGFIRAYRNVNGFNGPMFANPGIEIGRGWPDVKEIAFADINGDTWDDLIKIGSNGEVWAWPNNGRGWAAGTTFFAEVF